MRNGTIAFGLVVLLAAGLASAAHPSLLLTKQGIDALKEKVQRNPAAKARLDAVREGVDASIRKGIELPPRGGNWYHWYVCPTHGNRLRTGRQIGKWQWEHICPVDSQLIKSDPAQPSTDLDGCSLQGIHHGYARAMRDAGLLWQLTGDRKYADHARDLLLAYAEQYAKYPLHTTRGEPKIGGGRIGPQTLDESTWLIPAAQGADFIWETLTDAQRQVIATKLLLPAARDTILAHKMGVHNIQCWKNSAVGLVGFLLQDKDLIAAAIDDPKSGYRVQLEKGVMPDGPWWEGAWGYHFYTVSALWPLAEAARNNGVDLYSGQLKKLFDAPLLFAMPDLVLPAFNDSHTVNLKGQAPIYELAYARFREPRYVPLIAQSARRDDFALWFGVDLPAGAVAPAARSANYPASGYAMLADGAGEKATWLCLKYGPHGGGHGHPDKLSFILYAGDLLAPDPGTTGYGSPYQGNWFKATLSHNTLAIDESSQKPAEGKCLAFGQSGGVQYAMADAGKIHDDVRFVRTVAMLDGQTILFVDQVRGSKAHAYDIACHLDGKWAQSPQGEPWTPPQRPGYVCLRDGRVMETSDGATLRVTGPGERPICLTLAAGERTQVISATGMGDSTAKRLPATILRRKGPETLVVWAISLRGEAVKLQVQPVADEGGQAIAPSRAAIVTATAGGRSVRLLSNPEGLALKVDGRTVKAPCEVLPSPARN